MEDEPTVLGFPAEESDTVDGAEIVATTERPSTVLVVHRRADPFAATGLVLAGMAANISLSPSWSPGQGPAGLSLVQAGARALGSSRPGDAVWEPFVVVLCGGLLVVLGFLTMIPARAHRLVGLLALLVALAAALAVVLLIVSTDVADRRVAPGLWCAVAVPVLGVLGALKAMLTAPLVSLAPAGGRRRPRRRRPVS